MKMLFIPLAIVAVLIAASPVRAAPLIKSPLTPDHMLTAEQLYQICTSKEDGPGLCAIYVMGVAEGMMVAEDKEFCPQGNIKYDAMAVMVTEALKGFQRKNGSAVGAVSAALSATMPCKK